jgi:hypothetical protein
MTKPDRLGLDIIVRPRVSLKPGTSVADQFPEMSRDEPIEWLQNL